MANWKSTVELADLHKAHRAGEMTINEVAIKLAERLKRNRYSCELEELIDNLECDVETVEDFDGILEELYDFGDADHRIWFTPS